ncbi:MAG: hypothetical protein P1S60_18945 [Anaerolineae bacterium]|nr:hypothetical protein [Anaerolineae bacterium]
MKKPYFSIFELILLTLFSTLVVVMKIALRLPLKLPGHSGIFWMTVFVITAGIVPKLGATLLVGVSSGILAAFLGMGDFGALNTFLSYTMVGLGVEFALWLVKDPEKIVPAAFIGIFGHVGKFLVKWAMGLITGAPVGIIALGMAYSLLSYIVFGALGGILGCLTLKALRKAGFFVYLSEKRVA